jgi:hypothetical protein
MCAAVAKFRNWAQKIDNNRLVYLDETNLRVNEAERTTLVAAGETPYVIVDDNSQYAARYDMIAAVCGDRVFPPIIYSPADREGKGVNAVMLNEYIEFQLAAAVGITDRYPLTVICDPSRIHNTVRMLESFHNGFCYEVQNIRILPASSAKRISPLDNALFHEWKQRCRQHHYITNKNIKSIMVQEWENIPVQHIRNYYRLCGLTSGQSVYKDCPCPSQHHHAS